MCTPRSARHSVRCRAGSSPCRTPHPRASGRSSGTSYLGETAIPDKYKELIGIAVAGATRCKYCQLFHAEGARLHGATTEELAEAAAMSGVSMMTSTYLNAQGTDFDTFERETVEIMSYVKAHQRKGSRRPERETRA